MPRKWLVPSLVLAALLGGVLALHLGGPHLRHWLLALHGIHE